MFSRAERVESVYRLVSAEDSVNTEDSLVTVTRTESFPTKQLDENLVQIGESVSEKAKTKLLSILRRHEQCFTQNMIDLGCTNVAEMNIELRSQRPVARYSRQTTPEERHFHSYALEKFVVICALKKK